MISLIGLPVEKAKAAACAHGFSVKVKENFRHQSYGASTLLVTGVKKQGKELTLIVGEFFLGSKNV